MRVAGVSVGKVSDVTLEGTHVRVDFDVDSTWIGDQSTAAIKIKTLLGQKYLAIDPLGDKSLDPGTAIPLTRTTAPYDVTTALRGSGRAPSVRSTARNSPEASLRSPTRSATPRLSCAPA